MQDNKHDSKNDKTEIMDVGAKFAAKTKEKERELKKMAAVEVWEEELPKCQTAAQLKALVNNEHFKDFLADLPVHFGASKGKGKRSSEGITRVRVTDDEVEALRKAFVAAKATNKEAALPRADILAKVEPSLAQSLHDRWQSVSKRLNLGKAGEKRSQVIWLKNVEAKAAH